MTFLTEAGTESVLAEPAVAEVAILRALVYADVFNYPLTVEEIQRYGEGERLALPEVGWLLESSDWLTEQVRNVGEFYVLKGRETLVDGRVRRAKASARLWQAALWYGRVMACLPFVRMVAVTGALAMNNAQAADDIDYLLVTAPGRVWLARACSIVVVRAARLVGVQLCPNYLLASTALGQDRRDLFIAHELAQMTPLTGRALYWEMRAANSWADEFLPNATTLPRFELDVTPGAGGRALQSFLEWLLGGDVADRLEHWEQQRKTQRFEAELKKPGSAARLDEQHIQGHFNDYGHRTLATYQERCKRYLVDFSL
jgi:hypothetical protein